MLEHSASRFHGSLREFRESPTGNNGDVFREPRRADRWPRRDIYGIPRRRSTSPFTIRTRQIDVSSVVSTFQKRRTTYNVPLYTTTAVNLLIVTRARRQRQRDLMNLAFVSRRSIPKPAQIAYLRPRHPVYLAHLHATSIKIRETHVTWEVIARSIAKPFLYLWALILIETHM